MWCGIVRRCENKNDTAYSFYGGRGIKMHPAWRASFIRFLEDIGRRPDPKLTLERIDNDGHYEPGNVTWATRKDQARNRRTTHKVTFNGESMSLAELAERTGIPYNRLWDRIRDGRTAEEAVNFKRRPPHNRWS